MEPIYVIWAVLAVVFVAAALGLRRRADKATRPDESARDPMFQARSRGRRSAYPRYGRPTTRR